MYACQRVVAWHFSCSIMWPNLPCLPEWEQRWKNPLGFSNNMTRRYSKSIEFSVSHLSLVSRTCLAALFITNIKWIRNSIWKIRNIRRIGVEIQYSRDTISYNSLFQALTFKATRIYQYNPLHRNTNSTTTLAHRTTV